MGALLALLIFLVAFGLVLTRAIPVWMAQDEGALSHEATDALASLQATLAVQASTGLPRTAFTPLALASGSVPVLASPTLGSAEFLSGASTGFVDVSWTNGTSGRVLSENVSLGALVVELPNRYINPETLTLQNGAVLNSWASQPTSIAYPPALAIDPGPGVPSITLTIVSMTGASESVSGPGTQEILDSFVGSTTYHDPSNASSSGAPGAFTMVVGSAYACAWAGYLGRAAALAGLSPAQYTLTGPTSCTDLPPSFGVVSFSIPAIASMELTVLDVAVSFAAGAG